jgi:beta propeller repeat protein
MNPDIYMYNLTAGTETPICTNTFAQDFPDIYGNTIVWQDLRNGGSDVYMYDLATGTETKLNTVTTNDPCSIANPSVYGDIVVWTDYRNSNYDIYMYDLSTSTETPVCIHSADQSEAAIYENRIVWTDYRISSTNPEIYLGEISSATPAEQSDNLKNIVANATKIPKSDFAGANDKVKDNRRKTLLNKLEAVSNSIQAAEASSDPSTINTAYQKAIDQLNSILDLTDGCSERGIPDTKGSGYAPDWITTCTSQAKLDPHIRDLIATLKALITP